MTITLPICGLVLEIDNGGGTIINSGLNADNDKLKSAFDAIESMVLAHAVAGVEVTSPAYLDGLETAVDAVCNQFDGD